MIKNGIMNGIERVTRNAIEKSDGILICTPEYVFSLPSGLKNALEWCVATTLFSEKPSGLVTASASGQKGHEELQLIMKTLMGLFSKLFGSKEKTGKPDNAKLLALLDRYWKENGAGDTYQNVVLELMNGNSFLLFPTQNDTNLDPDKWTTLERNSTLKLASVVNIDGLKVLGVFTDENALHAWTKKPGQYTTMYSKDVLKFVQDNGLDRIVINSDQPNMFVLERNSENIETRTVEQDTTIQMGTPQEPLSNAITQKLIDNFKRVNTISEVYQYGQTKEGEFSIVLAFKLTNNSDNAKKAAINSVQNALENMSFNQALDIFFIETEDWYTSIRKIQNSLFYRK